MQGQKSQPQNLAGGGGFRRELKLLGLFLAFISFLNLVFSHNTFALYTPTLSVSVDNSDVTISGNDVINSYSKMSLNSMNLTVKTNNRTGYTAAISTETDDTSLKNLDSTLGAKIQSITENLALNNFTANTWGYKMGSENNFKPIPAASNPSNIIQTTVGTGYDETNKINIGMKLSDTLESGNYTNKIIVSVISNPYEKKARINRGYDFNVSVGNLDKNQTIVDRKGKRDNIYHIKRSLITKDLIPADAVNIENGNTSDYEVKIWFAPSENTAYYWTEADKITLSKDSSFMFDRMSKLQTIDLSGFDTSEAENMARMFSNSPELKSLDFSGFNTGKVKDFTYTFYDAKSIESLDLSMFDTSSATTMYGMFNGMTALKNLNISSFNTQNVTEMQEMFQYNSSLTSLDLSHFDTRKVKNMRSMFNGMSNVTSLDLSSFNTQNVTDMGRMFAVNPSIQRLDLSSFNTSKVTTMNDMFNLMISLTQINFGANFDTSNVTDMTGMFYQSTSLVNLDLSHFNTRKVKSMNSMFSQMSGLIILDISNFETPSLEDAGSMFAIDPGFSDNLEKIYVNQDFDTSKLTTSVNMFIRRYKLRGGNGSYLSNPATADLAWLRVDRPGVQGYFTRKP